LDGFELFVLGLTVLFEFSKLFFQLVVLLKEFTSLGLFDVALTSVGLLQVIDFLLVSFERSVFGLDLGFEGKAYPLFFSQKGILLPDD
jgi:hypothetical protein